MTKRIVVDIEFDALNELVLDDLIDHFDSHDDGDIELQNALLRVIKYYSTEKQWKHFKKIREV
jgi:hypothetical protein